MDVVGIFGLLYRRKRIVIPLIVLALVSMVAAYKLAPPQYKASGALVLLGPPADTGTPTTATTTAPATTTTTAAGGTVGKTYNPYLTFTSDIGTVVAVLQRVLASPAVLADLRSQGLQGKFVVAPNIAFYSGPIVDINATADTSDAATKDVNILMGAVSTQLALRQQQLGVPTKSLITTSVVSPPTPGTKILSSVLRRLIAILVLDIILVLFAAVSAEAMARRREARKAKRALDASAGHTPPFEAEAGSPIGNGGGVSGESAPATDGYGRTPSMEGSRDLEAVSRGKTSVLRSDAGPASELVRRQKQ